MRKKTKREIESKEKIKEEESFPIKIGLEIHGYLDTQEKLFCKCKTSGEERLNSRVCPICTGQPGSKPMMPNREAVKKIIQIASVLGCKINHDKNLVWQRKHYSWPDLPKGYQNTISGAYSVPVAERGKFRGIKITEAHLEEDPAQWNPETGSVNYNRSGLPLVEIVTDPDFTDAEGVVEWLQALLHSLSYIKAVRKNAGIKADVNLSTYGDRVEMKNLNSLESIKKAIEYETRRQLENYSKGIIQKQETLRFDEKKGITMKMREKESSEDYRFIPDPDLPVIKLSEKEVKQIERELPEMPEIKLNKLLNKYKIDKKSAEILAKHLELVVFFEELAKHVDAKKYIFWITVELLRVLNWNKKTLEEVDIRPVHLAELIQAIDKKQITELKAKQIMNEFFPKSFSVLKKVKTEAKISDEEVEEFCKQAIKENPKAAEDFKLGKRESLNFLVGSVMKLSNRRADFKTAREVLIRILS